MRSIVGVIIAALIFHASFNKAKKLTKARVETEKILFLLNEIKNRISYCDESICRIITSYSDFDKAFMPNFILHCSEYLKDDDIHVAWKKSVTENAVEVCEKDRKLLLLLGNSLGTSDKATQLNMLSYMTTEFEASLKNHREKEEKEKKLYYVIGVSVALTAFILIV